MTQAAAVPGRRDRGRARPARRRGSAASSGGAGAGRAPASPGRRRRRRLPPEQPAAGRRRVPERVRGVAVGAEHEEPSAQVLLGIEPRRSRRPPGAGGRGQERAALDEDELARDGDERRRCSRAGRPRASRARRGTPPRARRAGTVRTSSRRASMSASRSPSGPSNSATRTTVAVPTPRVSPNATWSPPAGTDRPGSPARAETGASGPRVARARAPCRSRGLVRDEEQAPADRVHRRRLVPARSTARGGAPRRRMRLRRPDSAWSRIRAEPVRHARNGASAGGPTTRTARTSDHRHAVPRAGRRGPSRSRAAAPRGAGQGRARRARGAVRTTSRPWRRSATGIASKRSSSAGVSHAATLVALLVVTRAATCARAWRTLRPPPGADDLNASLTTMKLSIDCHRRSA